MLNVRVFRTNVRFGSFYYIHVTRKNCQNERSYEKFVRLTLMKLTTRLISICLQDEEDSCYRPPWYKRCNCDVHGVTNWTSDEGYLTDMDLLPVRIQVHVVDAVDDHVVANIFVEVVVVFDSIERLLHPPPAPTPLRKCNRLLYCASKI